MIEFQGYEVEDMLSSMESFVKEHDSVNKDKQFIYEMHATNALVHCDAFLRNSIFSIDGTTYYCVYLFDAIRRTLVRFEDTDTALEFFYKYAKACFGVAKDWLDLCDTEFNFTKYYTLGLVTAVVKSELWEHRGEVIDDDFVSKFSKFSALGATIINEDSGCEDEVTEVLTVIRCLAACAVDFDSSELNIENDYQSILEDLRRKG